MHSSQLGAGARYTGVGALILVAGCATHTAPRPIWEGTPDDSDQQITLRISNHLWNDVVVYSFASGARVRLGMSRPGFRNDSGFRRITGSHRSWSSSLTQ